VVPASTDAILESISDGVFTVDEQWRITSFNRAAEAITGVPRAEALGRRCCDVFRSSLCESACALRETLQSGRPIVGRTGYIVDAEGRRVPISLSTAVMRDGEGRIVGGAETFRDLSEVETLREELAGRHQVGELTSRSPAMQRVFAVLPVVAESESTVLVCGETGTGKELLARTIHALSGRRDGPFVAVNCGALPDTLLESELFGYRAGAFTGADRDRPGRFAAAAGGTLLLDEIGEVSPALQVRLLRVLQERVYEPLGSNESEKADVRVIAATHRDLAAALADGSFREDLYWRINVIRIDVPPLRERKEDLPLLVDQFVGRLNLVHGRAVDGLAPEALSLLLAHDWPGNVRELENVIERAFVLCREDQIGLAHLPPELTAGRAGADPAGGLRRSHDVVDAQAIRAALERCGGNRTAAARELGIHRSTLLRRLTRLGIAPPERDGRARG
jgi:PAS domain S-box-containing protein